MTRKHEPIASALLHEVVRGRVAPGEWLPREVDLAERFGVARGTAREAIAALRERGLVGVTHGRGQVVRPEEEWDLLDDAVLFSVVARPERQDLVTELLECRRVVEGDAAALAAERATGADIRRLADAYRALAEAAAEPRHPEAAHDPLVERETGFHRALVAVARNRPLGRMLLTLHRALAIARHYAPAAGRAAMLEPCDRALSAVSEHDADAARAAVAAAVEQLAGWLSA